MRYYFDQSLGFLRYLYRKKSWPRVVLGAGVTLVAAAAMGGASIIVEVLLRMLQADSDPNQQLMSIVGYLPIIVLVIGFMLIVGGSWVGFIDWRSATSRRYGIAIELRGLENSLDLPLERSVAFKGIIHKQTVLVDVRNQLDNDALLPPEPAIRRVTSLLPTALQSAIASKKGSDVQVVFGGLAAVPLTFLAGMLVDDETQVLRVDWDRSIDNWRTLDDIDNGERFEETTHRNGYDKERLVLCVSGSYPVDVAAVSALHLNAKIIELKLPGSGTTNHWSDDKQRALSIQFLQTAIEHSDYSEIHLHMAAPSSMVFLFGQRYDKRNLPPINVYQYERSSTSKYPWAVRMPSAGGRKAEVIWG